MRRGRGARARGTPGDRFTPAQRAVPRVPPDARAGDGGEVVETTEYRLAVPWWGWLFLPLVRSSVRRPPGRRRTPWWAPPDQLDARAIFVLGLLGAACLAVGYLNTLFTQTVDFAADEFGASEEAQGVAGTVVAVRDRVLRSPFVIFADRVGRKKMLVIAAFCAPILCALGAVAPRRSPGSRSPRPWAGRSPSRSGCSSASWPSRRCPGTRRAYAISLLALSTGLGAGLSP